MIFKETKLKGAFIIELEKQRDARGFFARTFCRKEFRARGLNFEIVQCSTSYNRKKSTLRGMHYQAAPHREAKLISCIQGAVHDVIIDLRPDSDTYCQWFSAELRAEDFKFLYVPENFAHGFQTLRNGSVVFYQMSEFYYPARARGIRWNDPYFGIKWALKNPILSPKDRSYKDWSD